MFNFFFYQMWAIPTQFGKSYHKIGHCSRNRVKKMYVTVCFGGTNEIYIQVHIIEENISIMTK